MSLRWVRTAEFSSVPGFAFTCGHAHSIDR